MIIKLITIHSIPNFGSVFQAYATCQFLKELGYEDVELIDYRPPYFRRRSLKSFIGLLLNLKHYYTRTRKFESFIQSYLPLSSKTYHSEIELKEAHFVTDVLIAGGDQLWNPYHDSGLDDAYKLTFFEGKKISYATSLGQTDLSREFLVDLKDKIKDFSAIGVREPSSVPILELQGLKAKACVDPVFLLKSDVYMKFIKPVKEDNYLLVYLVTPSKLLDSVIDYLSSKYSLKVVLCSGFSKKCRCDVFLKDLGPDEILSYIKNASIVLSSSFHATSFSLIFEKQFYVILPGTHTNARIVDLLENRDLLNRIVYDNSNLDDALQNTIDYSSLVTYTDEINASKQYFKAAISNEDKKNI